MPNSDNIRFIAYPGATMHADASDRSKKLKGLLWGDWAAMRPQKRNGYQKISCRGASGWVKEEELQTNRILEVNFIDVGQGDGCFIVTPDDKFILIDAGDGDNMYRFLRWRFNLKHNQFTVPIDHLIISHPDKDHYYGFRDIIDSPRFDVKRIWHNGLIERKGKDRLGPVDSSKEYHTDVIQTIDQLKALVGNKQNRGGMLYPNMLYRAAFRQGIGEIRMLQKGDVIEGLSANDDLHFEILGPVVKQDATTQNKPWLKSFGKDDKTKNGQSVIIKLQIGDVSMMLGGDLNEESEEYLAEHYTGYHIKGIEGADRDDMIKKGREVFQVDIAKSCHHGSPYFNDDFLRFFNPVATVISSGDNETHTHPRPDTLGAIGKASRGKRPLIFSTELARSAEEKIEFDKSIKATIKEIRRSISDASTREEKEALVTKLEAALKKEERNVTVYGMINVRTDGKKIQFAQKKEQSGAGFITWELEKNADGDFELVPKRKRH